MSTVQRINALIDTNQFNYFGIMSVSLMAGTCLASVALLVVLACGAPTWELVLLSCVAMASNATAISHSPLRWVVWMFAANIFTSLFLMLVNCF